MLLIATQRDSEVFDLPLISQSAEHNQETPPMGYERRYEMVEGRQGDTLAETTALFAVGTLAILTWVIVLSNDPRALGWFALHPLLQTLAISLFTYGILTLQPTSQPKTKAAGLYRHQVAILLFGLPSILLGTLAVSYNKWLGGARHFSTWHGTLGIVCIIWLVAQVGFGAGSVWYDGAVFGGGIRAKAVWKYHRLSGYILFPLLLLTAHLGGAWSNWGAKYGSGSARFLAYTLAPILVLSGVYMRIR
ncbi:hypothetical protein K443DRAFT_89334 [Laccaria amethystina LaAM-08-1]|uniref:Cytochrome b561 domain-containing protein n=1 Tax=Laccaria amethystina LaAM-08-1 TaxID=1095629 RepID=A0A0C9XN95_9AGAR|nr:hypothetical protein K443DRAFT_89334 [Laccaria amethystina LaAM-08-1]